MIELILPALLLTSPMQERMSAGTRPTGNLEAQIRERLGDDLRDPASAEIRVTRGLRRSSMPIDSTTSFEGYAVCATVNAKNAYGAFVGRQPYVFMWWGSSGRLASWPINETNVPEPSALLAECDHPAD